MKKLILLLCAAAPAIMAQDPKTSGTVPAFASDWRVTGVIRQGNRAQASMERTGVRSRFVHEGDRLPGEITVVQVDYGNRSVTLAKGNETAVIQVENVMAPALPPPKAVGMHQQTDNKVNQQGSWPNPPQKTTAMRDGNGRWHVVFPNGHSTDMQSYAERFGGIKGAIDHVKEHLKNESNTERAEFHKQQLEALNQMQASGAKCPASRRDLPSGLVQPINRNCGLEPP